MAGWASYGAPIGSGSTMHVHVWRAAEARAALEEASRFVGTDVAERRNLIMVNPAPVILCHDAQYRRSLPDDPTRRDRTLTSAHTGCPASRA